MKGAIAAKLQAGMRAVRRHRAYREGEDLFVQALARTIFRRLFRIALDLLITWALILLLDALLARILPAPSCLRDCFAAEPRHCCLLQSSALVRLAGALSMIALGSHISTRWAAGRVLQHSAILNVCMLLCLAFASLGTQIPLWARALVLAAAFLAGFAGFRSALPRRRKAARAG